MHKHKYMNTNTNTRIQIQIHEYKYKSTNTQLQTTPNQRVGQGGWPPHFRKSHDKPKPKWATSKKKVEHCLLFYWTTMSRKIRDNVKTLRAPDKQFIYELF